MTPIEAVRLRGYHARLAGRPRTDNPYTARAFRAAWFAGYDRATRRIRNPKRRRP